MCVYGEHQLCLKVMCTLYGNGAARGGWDRKVKVLIGDAVCLHGGRGEAAPAGWTHKIKKRGKITKHADKLYGRGCQGGNWGKLGTSWETPAKPLFDFLSPISPPPPPPAGHLDAFKVMLSFAVTLLPFLQKHLIFLQQLWQLSTLFLDFCRLFRMMCHWSPLTARKMSRSCLMMP